ncbi:MAG TPA: YceH family protein [Marinagarivorans sp.]
MQELSLIETRVIGCLIEKAVTTPDQYPLSLNSLANACNQKSNRDPVLELDESEVQAAVDSLVGQNLVSEVRYGARVAKYRHRFGTSEFAEVRYNDKELAVLCLLFLRGPQTPGELRTRSARLATFKDVADVEAVLLKLAEHSAGPFVQKLPREPGKREHRWVHLFSGAMSAETMVAQETSASAPSATLSARVESLESELSELRTAFAELKAQFDDLMA